LVAGEDDVLGDHATDGLGEWQAFHRWSEIECGEAGEGVGVGQHGDPGTWGVKAIFTAEVAENAEEKHQRSFLGVLGDLGG
jgi:hypothetical protein